METQADVSVEYQEAEYRRLARLLHDDLGQLLAALCMHLQVAVETTPRTPPSPWTQCLAIAEQAMEQVRDVSCELCPSILDDAGLAATLPDYLDRQARRTGLQVSLLVSSAWKPLPRVLESTCFRVIQEAVRQVLRRAPAAILRVELRQDAEAVHLTIADDAAGVEPAAPPRHGVPSALGMAAMRQRVEAMGGEWSLESAPFQGTSLRVRIPVESS